MKETIERFKKQYFPEVSNQDWNSWHWQLKNRFVQPNSLKKVFNLSATEWSAINSTQCRLPISITPYYAAVIQATQESRILQKTVIPDEEEFVRMPDESIDPLIEKEYSPVPNIVHRYPNRVLFLTTQNCAVYCRYCTRSRMVGDDEYHITPEQWQEGINYIKNHTEIHDVIVSGGDPLYLTDGKIEGILSQLRQIKHVQIIRLGTKIPITLPQRITDEWVEMLRRFHPVYLSLHVIHPSEITEEVKISLAKLADAGIVMGSQTVLLRGINDQPEILVDLMEKLLCCRVRPYALFICDPVVGSLRFRTTLQTGLTLIEHLRKNLSGYGVPQLIVDPPGGKVALSPSSIISRNKGGYVLKNGCGEEIYYSESSLA